MLLSSFFDLLIERLQKLTRKQVYSLLTVFLVVIILLNGLSLVPNEHYQSLAQNPFISRTDIAGDNYWQSNVLLPVLAYYTRLNSRFSFNALTLLIFILAFFLFVHQTVRKFGTVQALIFSTILLTNPLTTVILSWLGTPDSLTLLLTIPFLFTSSTVLLFLLAILGMMNHPAFIIAVTEILILRWVSHNEIKMRHLVAVILGGVIGYALIQSFLGFNHIQIAVSRLDFILANNVFTWVRMNALQFPMTLFSLFNIQWLIILVSIIMLFKTNRTFYSCLLLILVINYGITFFTKDTTRVFAILSWGILMECIFHSYQIARDKQDQESAYQKQYLQTVLIVGFLAFITPRYYSFDGVIHPTPFYEFLNQLVKGQLPF